MGKRACKKIGEVHGEYVYLCPDVEEIEETLKDLDRLIELKKQMRERKAMRKKELEKLLGVEILE